MELEWPQRLIVMQDHLLKLNEALTSSQVEKFTESSTFKVRNGDNRQLPIVLTLCKPQRGIVPKVKVALLGPNIWVYVKGIGEFIIVMPQNHQLFVADIETRCGLFAREQTSECSAHSPSRLIHQSWKILAKGCVLAQTRSQFMSRN